VEIYFSAEQRKALTPNDFRDLVEVERRLYAFQRRYQRSALPFDLALHPLRPRQAAPPSWTSEPQHRGMIICTNFYSGPLTGCANRCSRDDVVSTTLGVPFPAVGCLGRRSVSQTGRLHRLDG
jgi:hypothetical protein